MHRFLSRTTACVTALATALGGEMLAHPSGLRAQERVSFPTEDGGLIYADMYGNGDQRKNLQDGWRLFPPGANLGFMWGFTRKDTPPFSYPQSTTPFISFNTINRYAKSTTDFDEVDDMRNFTSEALFSQSQIQLNRALTEEELAGIIRTKEQFETFNNLRFRPRPALAIDLSYKYRKINDAQITNFLEPNQFNTVNVSEYGIAVQSTFDLSPYGFLVRGAYKRVNREGIIEFLPDSDEDVNQYEVNALVSRSFGDGTAALYATYVFQDIQLNIPNPFDRDRDVFALLFTYGKQDITEGLKREARPTSTIETIFERRFDARALKFFGGVVLDIETFGGVDVKKSDYFVGTSLCTWMGTEKCPIAPFDITIGPDVFTSEVKRDPSQDNAQYRTNVTIFYQINHAFLLSIPFRHDVAIEGPDDFESWKTGVEVRYQTGTRFFTSLRYDHQRFLNVDKDLDLFGINISLTF